MEKLEKLRAEKFRILKDSELKGLVGKGYLNDSVGGCSQGGYCGGGCSAGTPHLTVYHGECYYSAIARQCVCSGASGGDLW